MKRLVIIVNICLVLFLSGCHLPGYNEATIDLTRRADNNSNYIEDIINEYGFTEIYMELDCYFINLVFIEPTAEEGFSLEIIVKETF